MLDVFAMPSHSPLRARLRVHVHDRGRGRGRGHFPHSGSTAPVIFPDHSLYLAPWVATVLALLEQALALIIEGSDGLSAHERAVVEKAIAEEHPWVAAIYEECAETGDVRGLVVGNGHRFMAEAVGRAGEKSPVPLVDVAMLVTKG